MNIRLATREDAEVIARLHAESWRVAYRGIFRDDFLDGDVFAERNAVWHQRLAAPRSNQAVLLAEESDEVIGFVCAYGNEDPVFGTFIDNLHVRLDQKRKGVGRELMRSVAGWSQENYPEAGIYLSVLEPNLPARRFYESLGATNYESRNWEPPGGGQVVDLRYTWPDSQTLLQACG
ncbi:MAG: N-acetyltransferase family protein [Acidiferrobacterales bacterium]